MIGALESDLPRAEPFFFGPSDRARAGWLHRVDPATTQRARGVVICAPFGYEAVCADRSLRHFASAAARVGVPALRFDYDGTGDSAGSEEEGGRWAAWVQSVRDAMAALRAETGVTSVTLLGVRLGVAIACEASAGLAEVDGLIAIAPIVAGRHWLRELRALQAAMQLSPAPDGRSAPEGAQESAGFLLTADTLDAVGGIDLTRSTVAPAPAVLILDRDDRPPSEGWVTHLRGLGARVAHEMAPGFVEMTLDPHHAVAPEQMIARVAEWLGDDPGGTARAEACTATARRSARVAPGVEEHLVFLEETRTVFGIVALPTEGPAPSRAIILLNSGAISHRGPARLYVRLARRWAARGVLVVRVDMSGIGESRPWPGKPENAVYPDDALSGFSVAVEWLRNTHGIRRVSATGLCSGAYHAFQGAARGLPLECIVPINPLVFYWHEGMSLDYPSHVVSEAAAMHKESIWKAEKWRKLLRGDVDLHSVLQIWFRYLGSVVAGAVRNVARLVRLPLAEDVAVELGRIVRRGIAVRFVFADGDPGEAVLRRGGGFAVNRLLARGQISIRRIYGPDHTFTPRWSQEALIEVLDQELGIP